MEKYYICWSDYDQREIEEFERRERADQRLVELLYKFGVQGHGSIDCIFLGVKLEYEIVERVKEARIKK